MDSTIDLLLYSSNKVSSDSTELVETAVGLKDWRFEPFLFLMQDAANIGLKTRLTTNSKNGFVHSGEAAPCPPFANPNTSPRKTADPSAKTYFNSKELSLHNVINSQKKLRKPNKFKPFWERLSEKTETKKRVCFLLDQLKNYELADKFRDCHARFH